MLMSLRLNPEYSRLLPKMTDEEFEELKASIKAEGQHYPIIVNEDLEVLDGHHRYQACIELGIEPDFEVRRFDDKLLEKKFVIEANLRRRHLNNFQLVELAVPLLEIEKALAKKRKAKSIEEGSDLPIGIEQDDVEPEFKAEATQVVARKAGVSTRTFEKGKKILEKASEDEKQKLREGKASITKVYSEIKSNENTQLGKEPSFPFKSRLALARFKTSPSFRVFWIFCKRTSYSVLHVGTRCLPAVNATRPCKSY